ncbi:MAG TPA: hypothetical protein VGK73_36445 [Polyangiaceae bacterium]
MNNINSTEPRSLLTATRPDIWARGLAMATALTGLTYEHKSPRPDGTIYSCGYSYGPPAIDPFKGLPMQERLRRLRESLRKQESEGGTGWNPWVWEKWIKEAEQESPTKEKRRNEIRERVTQIEKQIEEKKHDERELNDELERLRKELNALAQPPVWRASVPDGAMEWLLHEVGHYVAATPAERLLPNYGLSESEHGYDGDRELQAWAVQEIILAPFGYARGFAPPTQRDGAAFNKPGPLPPAAMQHAAREIARLGIDVEMWRVAWGEWVKWGRALQPGKRPWEAEG